MIHTKMGPHGSMRGPHGGPRGAQRHGLKDPSLKDPGPGGMGLKDPWASRTGASRTRGPLGDPGGGPGGPGEVFIGFL